MLYFWAILVAVAIAISIPANVKDFIDITDKVDDFSTLDNLKSQPFTTASIFDRGCIPATSMNDIREKDTIYRRSQVCKGEQTYIQTSREHLGVTTRPPFGPPYWPQDPKCVDFDGRGVLLTCGGPEVIRINKYEVLTYDVTFAINCVPGQLSFQTPIILLMTEPFMIIGTKTEIFGRGKHLYTDIVAEYCCNHWNDSVSDLNLFFSSFLTFKLIHPSHSIA